ncbi:MAG: sugar phosphate isomerase/epimerase [Clostridia bacterium]|nr:sugar phosphate isomerase/epimerase [Clostridia bacterium]
MIRLCAFSDEADASLAGQIAALKDNGICLTELRSVSGKNVKDFTVEEAREIAAELAKNGISVWSIGSPLGKTDVTTDFGEYEKEIRHVCEIAQVFGAKNVRLFSFFNAYEEEEEVVRRMRAMAKILAEYGLTPCHENEKEIYGDTAARVIALLDKVPTLSSVYDPANFVQVGEEDGAALLELQRRAKYFHIKDASKKTEAIVPAGKGDGGIPAIVARIAAKEADQEQDVVLTLEPHLALFDGYAQIDNTELKHEYRFDSATEAFSAAANALKGILTANGYQEIAGGIWKHASRT